MKNNIKIYISCHKPCFVPKHPFLFPIQVGAQNAKERFVDMLHDDEGINISAKNPMYCELTAQYWAWKNDQDADYYGFFHYRRYMNFSEKILDTNLFEDAEIKFLNDDVINDLGLDPNHMEDIISQYDIITTRPVILKKLHRVLDSNYTQYIIPEYQYAEDLDVLLEIIKEKYPDYYETAEYYMKKAGFGYFCNMFIMKKELFNEYSKWVFDILEEHEKRRDYTDYTIAGYRVSGYLAERLFGIYYLYKQKNCCVKTLELQRTLFGNTEPIQDIKPIYSKAACPIVMSSSDYFAPFTAVTIQSIIDNSTKANNYDIIMLTGDMSAINQGKLKEMVAESDNFSIRFVNPMQMFEGKKLFTKGHFSVETYFRLALPELLPEYEKIVYIDSDMIVERDIADLFKEDVTGFLIAACYDADSSSLYRGIEPKKKKYVDEVLKMDNPFLYFQAGTLVINLNEFRKTYTTDEIIQLAVSREWELLDQDVLNVICYNHVKYIDMRWNVMVDYNNVRKDYIQALAPQWQAKMYSEARNNPYIIHYAGPDKPWYRADMDFGDRFWKYARETMYYEVILQRMMKTVTEWYVHSVPGQMNAIKYIKRGIQCINDHGIYYTFKYIPKRLGWRK